MRSSPAEQAKRSVERAENMKRVDEQPSEPTRGGGIRSQLRLPRVCLGMLGR